MLARRGPVLALRLLAVGIAAASALVALSLLALSAWGEVSDTVIALLWLAVAAHAAAIALFFLLRRRVGAVAALVAAGLDALLARLVDPAVLPLAALPMAVAALLGVFRVEEAHGSDS